MYTPRYKQISSVDLQRYVAPFYGNNLDQPRLFLEKPEHIETIRPFEHPHCPEKWCRKGPNATLHHRSPMGRNISTIHVQLDLTGSISPGTMRRSCSNTRRGTLNNCDPMKGDETPNHLRFSKRLFIRSFILVHWVTTPPVNPLESATNTVKT